MLRAKALASMIVVAAGCATREYPVPALPPPEEAPALYAPAVEQPYRLQVGDTLAVRSYFDSQLNQEVVVRPDGRISLLLIGDVVAADLTTEQLAERIREPYRRLVGNTDLTVALVRGVGMNVYVNGEIKLASLQPLDGGLTLLQAIARAGGTLVSANTNNVLLLRNDGAGNLAVRKVDLEAILRGEAPDVPLRRRDVVYVPKSEIAQAGQFVDQYINALVPQFIQVQLGWFNTRTTNTNPVVELGVPAP